MSVFVCVPVCDFVHVPVCVCLYVCVCACACVCQCVCVCWGGGCLADASFLGLHVVQQVTGILMVCGSPSCRPKPGTFSRAQMD